VHIGIKLQFIRGAIPLTVLLCSVADLLLMRWALQYQICRWKKQGNRIGEAEERNSARYRLQPSGPSPRRLHLTIVNQRFKFDVV
jgi:hypothetical protein